MIPLSRSWRLGFCIETMSIVAACIIGSEVYWPVTVVGFNSHLSVFS